VEDGGNVGIGINNPIFPLHIKDNTPHIYFEDTDGGSKWRIGNYGTHFLTIYEKGTTEGDRLIIEEGGDVGIGTISPSYKLDVNGDIHCTGKLTSDGGNDPPYVLYNYETRQSIIERVKREVTPDKLNGAVMFYNGEANRMELYLPSKGEFRDLQGNLLASVSPITKTFETKTKYFFDRKTGEVKAIQVPVNNSEDGQFYEVIKSTAGEIIKKKKAEKAKAIELDE